MPLPLCFGLALKLEFNFGSNQEARERNRTGGRAWQSAQCSAITHNPTCTGRPEMGRPNSAVNTQIGKQRVFLPKLCLLTPIGGPHGRTDVKTNECFSVPIWIQIGKEKEI